MKVLISAYSCEPGKGSERGVGWNVAKEMAKFHQVWVITRPDESKIAIERELAINPVENLNFVYFTLPFWKDSLRYGQTGAMKIHYYFWQIQAYFVAKKLHQMYNFDVIHHVTFVNYYSPSLLSFLPVPFIWGPVGGGENTPRNFGRDFSLKAKIYELARDIFRKLGEFDPLVRLTVKHSAIIRATTEDTAFRLHKMGAKRVDIVQAIALQAEEIERLNKYSLPIGNSIRFISIGRLLHWKGFHLGIKAFAKANIPNSQYIIIGEGPEYSHLQQLTKELGVADRVSFLGFLAREKALDQLRGCHVLIHPSLHDSGGWVCIEAMAAGRPVICLDTGGPGVQVSENTGFKVPANNPGQAINDMTSVMNKLFMHPSLISTTGEAARQSIQCNYSWDIVAERLHETYISVAGG